MARLAAGLARLAHQVLGNLDGRIRIGFLRHEGGKAGRGLARLGLQLGAVAPCRNERRHRPARGPTRSLARREGGLTRLDRRSNGCQQRVGRHARRGRHADTASELIQAVFQHNGRLIGVLKRQQRLRRPRGITAQPVPILEHRQRLGELPGNLRQIGGARLERIELWVGDHIGADSQNLAIEPRDLGIGLRATLRQCLQPPCLFHYRRDLVRYVCRQRRAGDLGEVSIADRTDVVMNVRAQI